MYIAYCLFDCKIKMAEDLSELLDDALGDFENNAIDKTQSKTEEVKDSNVCNEAKYENGAAGGPAEIFQMFNPEMAENLQKEWQAAMTELKSEKPELAKELDFAAFQSMTTQNVGTSTKNDTGTANLDEALDAAVFGVHKSAEEVNKREFSDDLLNEMGGLNLGNDGNMQDGLFAMMEEMMKSLLSKEVLYPAMKRLSTSYGPWLSKNKDLLSHADYDRFIKQKGVIINICRTFEEESEVENQEVKTARYMKIMNLVQEMQNHGDPPTDLMNECGGEEGANLQNIFKQGNPMMSGFPPNPNDLLNDDCVVM